MFALLPTLLSIVSDLIGGHLFGAHKAAGGGLNASTLIPLVAGVGARVLSGGVVLGLFIGGWLFNQPFRECIDGIVVNAVKGIF